MRPVGLYVHHVGQGHRTRAAAVAGRLDAPVVGLGSMGAPPGPWTQWVELPRDDTAAGPQDVTGHGALHWVPRDDDGLRARMAVLAAWVRAARPACVVVDVSVEVAVFLRLLGVPVVVVALPGRRSDPAHQLAYRLADAVLAFWPQAVMDPDWLAPHADRVHFVGALSRYDTRPRTAAGAYGVVLSGSGGGAVTAAQLRSLPGDREWRVLGGAGEWLADPWPVLCGASVVVTHAGQNALAEVAAARRPAVVVPQERPHDEQVTTAAALSGVVATVTRWPEAAQWPAVLRRAEQAGGGGWARWHDGAAAGRAAALIARVAGTVAA